MVTQLAWELVESALGRVSLRVPLCLGACQTASYPQLEKVPIGKVEDPWGVGDWGSVQGKGRGFLRREVLLRC